MANGNDLFYVSPETRGIIGGPGAADGPGAAPQNPTYQRVFNYEDADQLDRDNDGSLTAEQGRLRGEYWDADHIIELNLYGEVVPYEQLRQLEGGEALAALARRKRRGRRGFVEAFTAGGFNADFIPYVGDLASTGIAIKNMSVVRDSLRKMAEQGPQALTLQEKVLTRLYSEDMERQSNQTLGGTVGTILRQAPAFAFEFLTTGAIARGASAAAGFGVKKAVKEAAERSVRQAAVKFAKEETAKKGIARAALSYTDDVLAKFGDDAVAAAGGAALPKLEQESVKNAAVATARATLEAYKNPSHLRNIGEFVVEYSKRGVFDHMDNVIRDLPPGVAGKLREAAGVAFIEAPVKGGLYAAFDFLAVNPVAARLAGAPEAVTKTELGLYATGDKELMDNAKMLAFGTAWAEYASEVSGRAFTALGGIVTENLASGAGRAMARAGLRATRGDYVQEGSVAKRLFDYMQGTGAEMKTGLAALKNEAFEAASKSALPEFAGKSAGDIALDAKLADKAVKSYLGFRDKSFLGYLIANKALEKNITPQAVTKLYEAMGYDDILGEFMEERYNGFAQGLFGLDGQEHQSNLERIAHAFKSAAPDSFQQGLAEILAFSVPVMSRAAFAKAYDVLGTGAYGNARELGDSIDTFANAGRGVFVIGEKGGRVIDVKTSDAASGSDKASFTARAGRVEIKEPGMLIPMWNKMAGLLTDVSSRIDTADNGAPGFWREVGKRVLGITQFAITGNPMAAFSDPVKATLGENLGGGGLQLVALARNMHRELYRSALTRRARESAEEMAGETKEERESRIAGAVAEVPESRFSDPEILAEIRPQMEDFSKFLIRDYLGRRGAHVMEESEMDAFADTLVARHAAPDGTVAGMTKDEFKKKYRDEIAAAAANRLTFDVMGDRVLTTYARPEAVTDEGTIGLMARSVEEYMARHNIATLVDGDSADPGGQFRAVSGTAMPEDLMMLAAGEGRERGDLEVDRARMELATRLYVAPNFADAASWKRMSGAVGDYARAILEINRTFLRPRFDLGDRSLEVAGTEGRFYLADTVTGARAEGARDFATVEETANDAAARLGAVRRPAEIYFTVNNTFFAKHASQLLSKDLGGSRGYMLGNRELHDALLRNPFMNPTLTHQAARDLVSEDLRLSALWLNRKSVPFKTAGEEAAARAAYARSSADQAADPVSFAESGATEDGYETIAARAANAANIKEYGRPDARGKKGFVYEPAAISMDGAVYIPYRHLGSVTALVEDGIENVIKRNRKAFMSADDQRRYSPVVEAFFNDVQPLLTEIRDNARPSLTDASGNPLSTAESKRVRDEARFLSDLFDPGKYNIEALSHAYAGFVLMQADAARERGIGMGGSAYYATLGIIARQVRTSPAYPAFASLLNRAVAGSAVTPGPSALARMTSVFVPNRFLDSKSALRDLAPDETGLTPVEFVGAMGDDIAKIAKTALGGMPLSGLKSATGTKEARAEQAYYARELALRIERQKQAADKGGNVREYYAEEYPYLLSEIKGERDQRLIEKSEAVVQAEEAAALEPVPAAVENAAGRRARDADDPNASSSSRAEDILFELPAVAISLGAEWLKLRPANPGDRRGKLDRVFDEWKRRDPLLSEASRQRFIDAVKKAGVWAPDKGEGHLTLSAQDEIIRLDDVFTQELGESDEGAETDGPVVETDDLENPDEAENGYDEGANAKRLADAPLPRVLRTVMHMRLPAALDNDQEALEMSVAESAALYPKGMKDPKSLASLFDEEMWTAGVLHPALADQESFDAWLSEERPENGIPLFDDMIAAFRVLGLDGVTRAADSLKGSTVKSVYTLNVRTDSTGRHSSVEFRRAVHSGSIDTADSLLRSLASDDPGKDAAAALKMLEDERGKTTDGRFARLAEAADLLFGKGNILSQTLRKKRVYDMSVAAVSGLSGESDRAMFTTWFVEARRSGAAEAWAPAGLLAEQMRLAAERAVKGDNAGAVRWLLRGDAVTMRDASNRGGVMTFLNRAAGTMDVTSRQRLGTNAGKVRAVDPSLSAGAKLFLKSPEFKAAYMAAGGKEEDFAADSRFARWPDGTPVFAATNGLRRTTSSASGKSYTSEVSQPAYDEVSDLAQLDFSGGKDAYARVAVYNSEKKLDRLVVIPRAALADVAGKETPSYADTLASVARIMRVPYLSAKRGGHHMGSGEAAEKQNVTVALMLTEDKASQENLHGMGFIGDADLAGYYRRQGFGSAAKVILTESPVSGGRPFYAKGQFILADREPAEGEVLPAAKDLYRIASGYAYLSDKDSFKETPLYYKAADGSKRTLLDLVLAKDLNVDVALPEGGTVKASDLAAELGVEAVAEKVNGAPVALVTMRMGLRSQWASAPSKLAKPHHVDIPVNYMMDNKQSMMAVLRQARVRAALAARTAGTALGKVYEGLESTVRELLDAGVSPRDPGVLKTLGPKMASALTKAFRPTMMGQKYLNRNFFGARVFEASPGVPKLDANGRMVVSDPFDAMKALPGGVIHDTYELSPEESAEMDGATRRMASTACNLGGTTARYGMRAVASALGKDESDLAGIAAEVENRVKGLKTAELRSLADNDPSVYLRYYREFIAPAFTDHNGNPMMPGQVVSFSDLVGKDGKFDRTRVYQVNEDGNVFVFLGGQLQISGRTPSYDGRRAEYAHSVAMPAYMEEADGTRKYTYTAVYVKRDGTLGVRHAPYPAGTLVPGRDAVLVMTPEAKYLAGSDEDWDTSHSQRLPTDAMGREIPELADAERLIAAAEDPRAAEAYAKDTAAAAGDPAALAKAQERFAAANDRYAESLADRAVSGLEATAFWGAIGVHRKYSRMMNPVTAAPFSAEHAATVPAEKKPALDTPEAAHEAWRNKEIGNVSRGIAVKSLCDLEAALDTGMRFDGPVNRGEPVAAGVSVGVNTNWSEARVRAFITAASGAANSTFDDLKEGLAFRAGFRPEFFDLYLYLAFESGATDMAGIEAFHTRFMEWMNGPEGSAVTRAYRNEAYPAKNGGSALARELRDTAEALMQAAEAESESFHYRIYPSLSLPHRRMATALAAANGGGTAGYDKAFGLVQTLYRMKQISAVGTVLAHKKSSLSAPGRVTSLENAVKTVTSLLNDDAVYFSAAGRSLLTEARDSASKMADEARRAFAGSVELSAAVEAAKTLPVSPASQAAAGTRSVMEMMKLSVSRRLPFEAAAMLTPRSTGAVITRLLNGVPDKERTARFLGFTETALRSLYREYAYASGEPNAALDALVAPSPASGVTRISMTGSEGSADVSGNIRAAMEAMRDWTASGSRLPAVTVKAADGSDVYVTPADFYWMLLQYSALTSGLTVESGRVSQSLIRAFYGTGMYKNLSDYAVERLENQTGLERMLNFTVSGTADSSGAASRKFPLDRIPDAFGDKTPLAFGMYDAAMAKLRRAFVAEAAPMPEQPLPEPVKPVVIVKADAVPAAIGPLSFWPSDGSFRWAGVASVSDGYEITEVMYSPQGAVVIIPVRRTADGARAQVEFRLSGSASIDPRTSITLSVARPDAPLGDINNVKKVLGATLTEAAVPVIGLLRAAKTDAEMQAAERALGAWVSSAVLEEGATAAPVNHTEESAAWLNARRWAKSAYGRYVGVNQRRLAAFARDAKAEAARMSDADAVQAADMGQALRKLAGLPWAAGIPGASDTLAAAERLLQSMRYPEPAVFMGAVRALGAAARAANAADALDQLTALYSEGNMDKAGSRVRLAALRDNAAVLSAPAPLRVMTFAVASTPEFSESKASSGTIAKQLLNGLGIGTAPAAEPLSLTASMAAAYNNWAFGETSGIAQKGELFDGMKSFRDEVLSKAMTVNDVKRIMAGAKKYPKLIAAMVREAEWLADAEGNLPWEKSRGMPKGEWLQYRDYIVETRGEGLTPEEWEERTGVAAAPAETEASAWKPVSLADMLPGHGAAVGFAPGREETLIQGELDFGGAGVIDIGPDGGQTSDPLLAPVPLSGEFTSVEPGGLYREDDLAQACLISSEVIAKRLAANGKDAVQVSFVDAFGVPHWAAAERTASGYVLYDQPQQEMYERAVGRFVRVIASEIRPRRIPLTQAGLLENYGVQPAEVAIVAEATGSGLTPVRTAPRIQVPAGVPTGRVAVTPRSLDLSQLPDFKDASGLVAWAKDHGVRNQDLESLVDLQEEDKYEGLYDDEDLRAERDRSFAYRAVTLLAGLPPKDSVPVLNAIYGKTVPRAAGPVSEDAAAAEAVQTMSASLYEDNPFGITDEELQIYVADEKAGKYYAAETLHGKVQKRLKALIPPMPDEFTTLFGLRYFRTNDGDWATDNVHRMQPDDDPFVLVGNAHAQVEWEKTQAGKQAGSFAIVAQAIEDWKRDEGVVYDPNDAYNRGEGFYHDIGAFNPSAPGLVGDIAKVLLAQEKKRRRGDLNYWEDTANQLVVSAYTWKSPETFKMPDSFVVDSAEERPSTFTKQPDGRWLVENPDYDTPKYVSADAAKSAWKGIAPWEPTNRPGSGLRFVIRPAAHQILWAAKGDVYSGTVANDTPYTDAFSYKGQEYRYEPFDLDAPEGVQREAFTKDGVAISREEFDAAQDKARKASVSVSPKAPAAEKLSLLSHTLAGAIEDRRPQNYNELGVRLALGNFYIEGDNLPKELSRLNEHLKRAFIAVHGSLDPVAPYTPKTVSRAAGPVSASMADYEAGLLDLVRRADAEIRNLTGESESRAYLLAAHPDDKIKRGQAVSPESVAARMPVYMEGGRGALNRVASRVAAAAAEIENMTGLGPARDAVLDALNVFFMPGTGRSAVKPFHTFAGKRYGEFMRETGLTVRAARAALLARRRSLADLPEDARAASEAALDEAERSFLSAWHLGRSAAVALRPYVNRAANPLRALFDVAEERLDPPEGVEVRIPTREEAAVAVSVLDPETGHPDPLDDFNVTFVDSDAWFYGTVFPVFRGADIRQILFDKEPLSIVANAYAVANRFEAYFGLDSETGSLRKIRNVKGLGHHLKDGGYVYDEASAADVEVMGRRKIIREQADIVSGNAFTDAEFELARWFGGAVYSYLGDGGAKARQATAGTVEFDLPWAEIARMKPEERQTFVSFAEAARRNGNPEARMYSIHHLLLRAQSSIPAELHGRVEAALQEAVARGAMSPRGTEAQAAYAELARSGYAVARRRRTAGVPGDYYDVRLAVPVSATAEVFAASSARDKLIRNGRQAGQLTMEAAASQIREAFDRVEKSQAALPWAVYGAAGGISDAGTAAPFFKGSGAYKYFARKLRPPETPAYRDAVLKEYESLRETLKRVRGSDGKFMPGERAAANERFARMFALLRDLHPQMFGKDADARGVWETVRHGGASSIGLNAESTAWDIAKAIYSASVARLHDSAWNDGAATLLSVESVGLEAFNRAIGEAAIELNEPLNLRGATFSDIYDSTGALPQNLTAGEALALHARETAEAARYRLTLNQLLMTADEDGRPLVYARPGANAADDTVPDAMWQNLARWWAETNTDSRGNGVSYDEARSGRENAIRLYDLVTAGKVGDGAKQTPTGGVMRYTMTRVDVPPGMETFSAVSAAKDKAGDDTKATLNASGGGEAANITRQVLAIGGYGRPDARLAQMNRALSWSKSASVMASVFFPIATAFESPAAAVGMGATLFGLTGYGAGAARWLKDNRGWIAKAVGVDDVGKAPFMADILRVIGSDDPALVDLKIHATLAGLSLADRAKNMMDTDRTVIAQDIKAITAKVRALRGVKAAKSVKALLEGAMEHSSEFAFEYVINATKLAVFAQMNERLRQKAVAAGRWWDPVRDMKKWANYINSEVGGIDPAMYPWMTPQMQQALKALMFSWEWTLGAWEAGGGGVLTQKLFGQTTPAAVRKFMFGRWVRMYGSVMIGIPLFMQMLGVAVAKAAGDDDDDDRWFTWQNEKSKQWKDFDVTPLLRAIANTHLIPFTEIGPTWGDIKRKEIPVISALIPALTGQEGDKPTTRRRRYYMHLGKQGWEVAGWFENPAKSFLSKMSMPAQKILEGVLGITPSMGWETPFSEMGFWERWTSLDPEKSALLNLGSAFLPFSVMGMQRAPEIGALSAVAPAGKGISKTRAENEMAAMFQAWGDAETYAAMAKGRPGAWTDLTAMTTEWLEALRLNGYDPETSLKNALAKARRPLYEKIHMALPAFPDGKADTRELEKAARGLYRLDFVAKNLRKSIKARDKQQHINRTGDFRDSTDALLRDAFENPYGRKADERLRRSAAGGGNVRKLLATDKVPRSFMGYKVLKTEELSESDLRFFDSNPDSPGFFDR